MMDEYDFRRSFMPASVEEINARNADNENQRKHVRVMVVGIVTTAVVLTIAMLYGFPAYGRYQDRQNASNQIQVNHLVIQQTLQRVEVEKQKAEVRKQEAIGIAEAQKTINATLTPLYIQHEAIQAQEKMVNSPNHTEIYIPSGANGVPLVPFVQNVDTDHGSAAQTKQ